MPSTQVDLFAKVRGHEREEQLRAARDADLLPYFRLLDGEERVFIAGLLGLRRGAGRTASVGTEDRE